MLARLIVILGVISLFMCGCASTDNKEVPETHSSSYMSWTPLNTPFTGIFAPPDGISYYGLSLDFSEKSKDSYGLSMGVISETKNSYLISTQLLWSENDNFSGLAASALCIRNNGTTNGITLAPLLFERKFVKGSDIYLPIFIVHTATLWYMYSPYADLLNYDFFKKEEPRSVNNALNLNLFGYYIVHNGVTFAIESGALENNGFMATAFLAEYTDANSGVVISGIADGFDNKGLVIAGINHCLNNGVAIGGLNMTSDEGDGLNIGVISVNSFLSDDMDKLVSRQIGILNFLKPPEEDENAQTKGFQFGAINVARSGLQIGLININPNSKIFPVMPFVNW